MASMLATLRDGLETAINAAKPTYVVTNFTLEAAWVPRETLEGLATDFPNGKVYIIGMAADDEPNQTRTNLCKKTLPVSIGIQKVINENPESVAGKTAIDLYVELEEQIRETCRKHDPDNFSWLRTESLKDEDGTPFSFMGLREANIFEAYFTAYFVRVLQ